ncbi:MAG: 50S ribosomal protein L1 [Candidatus Helarchaeales archaeon]
MPLKKENIMSALGELRKKMQEKKRNFSQSIDVTFNLKDLDLKQPKNRINVELKLPHPINRPRKICVIAQGDLALRARNAGADRVIEKDELEIFGKDKKLAKKLAKEYDYFIVARELMGLVAKNLGPALGPAGKMPLGPPKGEGIVEIKADIEGIIERYRQTVRLRVKKNPVIQCIVGTEDMKDEEICENIMAVDNAILHNLEKTTNYLKSVYVKATMSPPVKIQI